MTQYENIRVFHRHRDNFEKAEAAFRGWIQSKTNLFCKKMQNMFIVFSGANEAQKKQKPV